MHMKYSAQIYASVLVFQAWALHKITLGGLPLYGLEIAFLIGVFYLLLDKQTWAQVRAIDKMLALSVTLYLGGALLSTLSVPYSNTQLGLLKSWFFVPITFFVLGSLLFPFSKRKWLLEMWFLGSSLICTVALYGFFSHYLTFDNRLAFPYTSPNFLAHLVLSSILIGVFFWYQVSGWKKAFLIGMLSCDMLILYETHSYSNWLALLVAGCLWVGLLWYQNRNAIHIKYLAMIVLGCILLGGLFVGVETRQAKWKSIFEGQRSSVDSRIMIWKAAWSVGTEYPLNGIGVGNFQAAYLAKQSEFPPYLEWAVPMPHNFWMAVWLQTGILGLVGMVLLLVRLGVLVLRKLKAQSILVNTEGLLIVALWGVFIVYGMFDTPYFRNDLAFLFWAQVLITYLYSLERPERD